MKIATILLLALTALAYADEKESAQPILATKPKESGARAASDPSLTDFQVFKNFTVPAGQSVRFNGQLDYTGADHANIAIGCPAPNSLKNVRIIVWWGIALADWLTATDAILGSSLLFSNMGGATVPVYGSQIQIEVRNIGTVDVSCDQLTIYAVVH